MKKNIESFVPPVLLSTIYNLASRLIFLRYKKFVQRNTLLKGIHTGKRCFLLGSGPSIKNEDLRPLRNEIVFALNNFYVHEDFEEIMSGDLPKYYMTAPIHPPQSEDEWRIWFEEMASCMPKNATLLFGLNRHKVNSKYLIDTYHLFELNQIFWFFGGQKNERISSASTRAMQLDNIIWSASTVSTYAILSALYMGFEEIYLLGVDHNYICIQNEDEYRFYSRPEYQKNETQRMGLRKSDEFISTSRVFAENEMIADLHGGRIFNCSSGSLLDMYPKVSLKCVLSSELE